jgi:hypothetical protein
MHKQRFNAALFLAAVFSGAFLLFVIEPMIAKMLLPKVGGAPAVWNTCMVFFQAALLAGYAYAHWISGRFSARTQAIVHIAVLCVPLIALPLAVSDGWLPPMEANPVVWVLGSLAVSAGLPFVVLSTCAPLLQKWYVASHGAVARDPYFLYSASNAGSFLALLAYPSLIEPLLQLDQQAKLWSTGYVAWAVLVLACAVRVFRNRPVGVQALEQPAVPSAFYEPPIAWPQRLRWIALAAVPSSYFLAVTTFITTDVAPIPLLWIAPLALYLLTFTIVFSRRPILSHRRAVFLLPWMMLLISLFMLARPLTPAVAVIAVHLAGLFIAAMVCHGELARTRPGANHLTQFYLLIAFGGVVGGTFNALLAPLIFQRPLEYPLAIALVCLIAPSRSLFRRKQNDAHRKPIADLILTIALPAIAGLIAWRLLMYAPYLPDLGGTVIFLIFLGPSFLLAITMFDRPLRFSLAITALLLVTLTRPGEPATTLLARRSFFGVYAVQSTPSHRFVQFVHGRTIHGSQHLDPETRKPIDPEIPITYYTRNGPIGQVMQSLAGERESSIAVVGLGVGSMAAYARPGMQMNFYEIDPLVLDIAERSGWFSYLPAARGRGANIQTILGDARLTLANAPAASIDLLILDAFSGDAIPVHLLTREAVAMYLTKLKPHGLIVAHISNRYLDLQPVIAALARDSGGICYARYDPMIDMTLVMQGGIASTWTLIARRPEDLGTLDDGRWHEVLSTPRDPLWTDNHSNVLSILRWSKDRWSE